MLDNSSIQLTINSQALAQIAENLAFELNLSATQPHQLKPMLKQQIEKMLDELVSDFIASPSHIFPSKFLRTVRLLDDDFMSHSPSNLPRELGSVGLESTSQILLPT